MRWNYLSIPTNLPRWSRWSLGWISNFTPHPTGHVITYRCWVKGSQLVFMVISVALRKSYHCPASCTLTLKDMKHKWTAPNHNKLQQNVNRVYISMDAFYFLKFHFSCPQIPFQDYFSQWTFSSLCKLVSLITKATSTCSSQPGCRCIYMAQFIHLSIIIAQVYRLSPVHCQVTRYSQKVPGYSTRCSVSANEISFDKNIADQIVPFKFEFKFKKLYCILFKSYTLHTIGIRHITSIASNLSKITLDNNLIITCKVSGFTCKNNHKEQEQRGRETHTSLWAPRLINQWQFF